MRVGLWRKLSAAELMLLNCGVGEDSSESLGLQGDQTVHPKGNQSWIFIGRTAAEAEAPMLCPPDSKNWLTGKDPDAGKDWRQEKRTTDNEMVGWHRWLDGHEFEQVPGVCDGQGGLVCCSSWGHNWATGLPEPSPMELNLSDQYFKEVLWVILNNSSIETTAVGEVPWWSE